MVGLGDLDVPVAGVQPLGGVFDETRAAIKELSDNVTPILEESTVTIQEANKQIARVDTITKNVAEVTGNVTSLVALFAASVGGPLIKIAGFSAAVRAGILSFRGPKDTSASAARRRRSK